jgi:Clostripain family
MPPDTTASGSSGNPESASAVNRGPKWTVMVFMGADTIDGTEPLDEAAEADLDEIRFVGGAETLDVYVQVLHSAGATERYHFGFDRQSQKQTETKKAMQRKGSDQDLIKFIRESIEESGHLLSDHSMLVLWGHAYDFAFARSKTRGGIVDAIDFVELSGMLQRLQDLMKARYRQFGDVSEERPTLDIIGFDACDVATVELACELQPFAKYLLGSEISVPIPGWPYDRILDRLAKPEGRLMTAPEFGSYVVRRFCESYPALSPVSLTFLNLAETAEIRAPATLLALALAVAIGDCDQRHRIMDLFTRSQTGENRPYVDVVDFCLNLVRYSGDPLVAEAARALGDLLLGARPPVVGKRSTGGGLPFIVEHGRNACELARLNGVSLYAPQVACGNDFDAVRGLYDRFVFAQETAWSGLVHALARPS